MHYFDTQQNKLVWQTILQEKGSPIRQEPSSGWLLAPELKVQLLKENAKAPTRSNPDDAGLDLYSTEEVVLKARFQGCFVNIKEEGGRWGEIENCGGLDPSRALVSTGIAVEVPPGLGLFIWDRSGLSAKHGIHRVAGVIDASYRGEIKVALVNLSHRDYVIKPGDRIAQAVLAPIILPQIVVVDKLSETNRGQGGFGSTGA